VDDEVGWLFDHFGLTALPVESTYYVNTYRSAARTPDGRHAGTAMIGLFCAEPASRSLFHRLPHDEIWHFYGGDALRLVLLHPDGQDEEVVLGPDLRAGHSVQHVVPAGTWQAGETKGRWSLFGCTLAPGFSGELFESGYAEALSATYPARAGEIARLGVPPDEPASLPPGFI
jgi:predicted cupin superfamily sugar epimerase